MSTPLNDTRRIESLERESADLRRALARGRQDTAGHPRHVFLAITKAGEQEIYPPEATEDETPPNAFPIVFIEPWFAPEEPGVADLDYNLGSETKRQAVAYALSKKYYKPETVVTVLYQRGKQPGEVGKWWIIAAEDEHDKELVHFRLLEPLSCGGSALAAKILWSQADGIFVDRETIRVYDDYGDRAVHGSVEYVGKYRGWAVKRGSELVPDDDQDKENDLVPAPEYSIVEIDHQAKFIEGLATEALDANSYLIILQRWYDGKKPEIVQVNEVKVVDQPGPFDGDLFYPRIPIGRYARVKAIWDPCAGLYRVWQAQQLTPMIRTVAKFPFCGGDILVAVDPGICEPYGFSPFNLLPNPPPSVAVNSHDLAGMADDVVTLAWHEASLQWVIIQVEHHELSIITKIERGSTTDSQGVSTPNCTVTAKKRKIWTMYCNEQEESEVVLNFTEHTMVESVDLDTSGATCKLVATLRSFCALDSDNDAGTQTVFTIGSFPAIDIVYVEGNALKANVAGVPYIAEALSCAEQFGEELIIEFTECDSSSAQ